MRCILALVLALAAFAGPASAQQANPVGFNATLPYVTAWDGSKFQVLTTDASGFAALDAVATSVQEQTYLAAHPAPPAPVIIAPIPVTHYQFTLLFTPSELVAFAAARAQAAALQVSDYQAVTGGTGTATQQALVGLQSFLVVFDAMGPGDIIDLRLGEAQSAVALLVSLGVITQARATVILTGARPS